jgi:hypothetical protein
MEQQTYLLVNTDQQQNSFVPLIYYSVPKSAPKLVPKDIQNVVPKLAPKDIQNVVPNVPILIPKHVPNEPLSLSEAQKIYYKLERNPQPKFQNLTLEALKALKSEDPDPIFSGRVCSKCHFLKDRGHSVRITIFLKRRVIIRKRRV